MEASGPAEKRNGQEYNPPISISASSYRLVRRFIPEVDFDIRERRRLTSVLSDCWNVFYDHSYSRYDIRLPCAVTTGLGSSLIDHDHTLNNNSGLYLFDGVFQLKTAEWVQSTFTANCFLQHVVLRTSYTSSECKVMMKTSFEPRYLHYDGIPPENEGIPIYLQLQSERVKLAIRLNARVAAVAVDDLSVHFCDRSPVLVRSVFSCDAESARIESFVSLSDCLYRESIVQADDEIQLENQALSMNHTFGNRVGHCAYLAGQFPCDSAE